MSAQSLPMTNGSNGHSAQRRVIVCAGTGCVASGAYKVFQALVAQVRAAGIPVTTEFRPEDESGAVRLNKSGCQGFCQMGPLVTVLPENLLYNKVRAEDVPEIVAETLVGGRPVERLLYVDSATKKRCRGVAEIPFYQRQQRFVLRSCGTIDPESIEEYVHQGGYAAAKKAYLQMTPEQMLEGLMIAARAIGADETLIYVRTEYPLAVQRMRTAVKDAEARGFLGDSAFGSGRPLRCEVMEGAGAFVCGEETAMIASIEGQRGMPRPKPPFPAQSGLWGKPTIINNVETLTHTVRIINEGAEQFRKLGTAASPGTKTFALTGHVANTGLVEVPFGTTLREVVFDIGGGITDRRGKVTRDGFKAVQIGGPSGGCLTREHFDLPLDYDSLRGVGAMVGSGGLVAMNNKTCMVAIARFFMDFTQRESCGKCVLCREGTRQMLALLDDIIEGRATGETLELLQKLASAVQKGSLCGLGKTAPNPVLSTLRYFRAEYDAHVFHKHCPTGQCKALAKPSIDAAKCKGCTACAKKCPVHAITGERKQAHTIDQALCIKCGVCADTCKFEAVIGV